MMSIRNKHWVALWMFGAANAQLKGSASASSVSWADEYDHHITPMPGYELRWKVDGGFLEVGMQARTSGWVGFGLAQPGVNNMPLADIVTAHVRDDTGAVLVVDRFSTDNSMPEEDCSQDWEVVGGEQWSVPGEEAATWTAVRARRLLQPLDLHQDRALANNGRLVRVIVAFGPTDDFSYHMANRKGLKIDMFGSLSEDPLEKMRVDSSIHKVEFALSNALYVEAQMGLRGFQEELLTVEHRRGQMRAVAWGRVSVPVEGGALNLSVATHGEVREATRVVLALHGHLMGGALYWAPMCEFLVRNYPGTACLAVEQRGYNRSSIPHDTAAYAVSHLASDVLQVAETLCQGKVVHLLGHGWGGMVAHAAALQAQLAGGSPFASIVGLDGPDGRAYAAATRQGVVVEHLSGASGDASGDDDTPLEDLLPPSGLEFLGRNREAYVDALGQGCDSGLCSGRAARKWIQANLFAGNATSLFDAQHMPQDALSLPVMCVWSRGLNAMEAIDAHQASFAINYRSASSAALHHVLGHRQEVAEQVLGFIKDQDLARHSWSSSRALRQFSFLSTTCQPCQAELLSLGMCYMERCENYPSKYENVRISGLGPAVACTGFYECTSQYSALVHCYGPNNCESGVCASCFSETKRYWKFVADPFVEGNCTSEDWMEDCLAEEERAAADGLRTEYEQCLAQSDCSQTNSDYSSDDDDVDGADDFNGRLLCDSFTPCYEGLELPSSEATAYVDACWRTSDMFDDGSAPNASEPWHVVGLEAMIKELTKEHVHHFVLYGYSESDACRNEGALFWAWGPGTQPMALPEEAGFPLAHKGVLEHTHGFRSIRINFHYDNPQHLGGIIENSGVRMFVSEVRRKHDAAVLQLADPYVRTRGNLPDGLSMVEYECPSTCTEYGLSDPVTVFASLLHMHQTGAAMYTQQIRDGVVVDSTTESGRKIDAYGANFQDVNSASLEMRPGDSFRTTCIYDTGKKRDANMKSVSFGLSTDSEMCIDFVFYYPSRPLVQMCGLSTGCGGIVQQIHAINASQLGSLVEWPKPCEQCPCATSESQPLSSPQPSIETDVKSSSAAARFCTVVMVVTFGRFLLYQF